MQTCTLCISTHVGSIFSKFRALTFRPTGLLNISSPRFSDEEEKLRLERLLVPYDDEKRKEKGREDGKFLCANEGVYL